MTPRRKSDPPAQRLRDRAIRDAKLMRDALPLLEGNAEFEAAWRAVVQTTYGDDRDAFRAAFGQLVTVTERVAPRLALFADEGLPQVLFGMLMSQALQSELAPDVAHQVVAAITPRLSVRVSPDNPIVVRPDGSAAFRPSDKKRDQDEVLAFLEELRPRPRTGRPRGSYDWTREEFVPAYLEQYHRELELRKPRRPTRGRIARRLGMNVKTLGTYLELYEESWPPK